MYAVVLGRLGNVSLPARSTACLLNPTSLDRLVKRCERPRVPKRPVRGPISRAGVICSHRSAGDRNHILFCETNLGQEVVKIVPAIWMV
jgi:hypothetical protein